MPSTPKNARPPEKAPFNCRSRGNESLIFRMDLTALREAHVTFGHLTCRAWEVKRASNAASRQKNQSDCKCYFLTAPYFTTNPTLSEWLSNSGAYMHWISAMPL